jgi:hypothetical protein
LTATKETFEVAILVIFPQFGQRLIGGGIAFARQFMQLGELRSRQLKDN